MLLILILMGLSIKSELQAASAQERKSRDILEFFKKAGENALKAISGLIPGGKPKSQLTTQPKGPRIPLNVINEDSIKPIIPYKRHMVETLSANAQQEEQTALSQSTLAQNPSVDTKRLTKSKFSKRGTHLQNEHEDSRKES